MQTCLAIIRRKNPSQDGLSPPFYPSLCRLGVRSTLAKGKQKSKRLFFFLWKCLEKAKFFLGSSGLKNVPRLPSKTRFYGTTVEKFLRDELPPTPTRWKFSPLLPSSVLCQFVFAGDSENDFLCFLYKTFGYFFVEGKAEWWQSIWSRGFLSKKTKKKERASGMDAQKSFFPLWRYRLSTHFEVQFSLTLPGKKDRGFRIINLSSSTCFFSLRLKFVVHFLGFLSQDWKF